ncbi:Rieske (2Fe-2S) protein [Streptomyces lavendulae]|uniref:Cytochrome bc1 complex Rieske iron-sulfur subunit n=1 Tax=Streptomyces lavendulae subsp. lavendulae TaxID=58340 RepID=A0A2K8PPG9_STRLA|nr:Rieske (2Fe-2S) protein [Streptomyces lavendulae]ATZ27515.1 Cytochrome b6-f complex iron-sulfur subunit [Streptomyces lavendulae subsp. lavendulae]QUQ57342.1 Cytochrome b6-f complex iron-sulfur subunit [Streptomyces lavendulae subsp. lavendulae]
MTDPNPMSDTASTARRTVLAAGAAALAGGTLAACGGGGGGTEKPAQDSGSAPSAAASPGEASGSATGKTLMKSSSEVPVGGGVVLKDQKLVVTQPTAGSFRCFSAVCTHEGCLVSKPENGVMHCPCHGSEFQASDGAVVKGPATRPLPEKKIAVAPDGTISLA